MDYENLYKNALERARVRKEKSGMPADKQGILDDIFPELHESEDEKIRKWLIGYFHQYKEDGMEKYANGLKVESIIDWLENQVSPQMVEDAYLIGCNETEEKLLKKQDEQKNKINSYKITFKDVLALECAMKTVKITKGGNELYEMLVLLYNKTHNAYLLEKQGEQKPTDKVEPKFKIEEGKWYVCAQTYVLRGKIVVIKGQTYQAEKDNVIKGEDGCLFIDRHDGKASDYFRLWTIQDAKDGDVLSWDDSKCIAIFKNIYDEDSFNSYGFVGGCTGTFESRQSYHDIEGTHPATKEQRDLLFQKMKEAGYNWDAEKKELKKIEQKPAWSEEDEIILEDIEASIINCRGDTQDIFLDWLKSLKDRMQPK